jgi:hypothetical protein
VRGLASGIGKGTVTEYAVWGIPSASETEDRVRSGDHSKVVRRRKDSGTPLPEADGERSVYFPMTYLEPFDDANRSLLGYDAYARLLIAPPWTGA